MRFISLIVFFAIHNFSLSAQQMINISGIVMDKNTRNSISWASIGIKGEPIGTLSGDHGVFDFHFSEKYTKDTLIISHVGFKHVKICINDILLSGIKEFLLEEEAVLLESIMIRSKTLSAKEIMKKAFKQINVNYPNQPYLMEAFYRDSKKINGQYVSLLEAATKIYDEGYADKSKESVEILEIRRSKRFVNEYETFVSSWTLLSRLLTTNDVKYRTRALNIHGNKYEIEGATQYNNEPVYIITTGSYRNFKIYVSQIDYSIVRIEGTGNYTKNAHPGNYNVNDSIQFKVLSTDGVVDFKPYQGRHYLNYLNYSWVTENSNLNTNRVVYTTNFSQELMVNNIQIRNVQMPSAEKLMQDTTLEVQAKPYNEEFWKNYNVLVQNPAEEGLISKLTGTLLRDPFERPQETQNETVKKTSFPVLDDCKNLTSAEKEIGCLIKHYHDSYNIPASQIAVSYKNKIIYSEAYGYADLEKQVPAKTTTPFRIASVSKSFAALAALKLVQEKKIDLERPVTTYIPAFPVKKWIITPTHLLTHTSGVRDYVDANDFYRTQQYNTMTDAIEIIKDDTLLFKPGTQFLYSSFGFNLVGAIIEQASGNDYLTYLEENIFKPLQMNLTFGNNPAIDSTKYYIKQGETRVLAPNDNLSYKWSSGGMTSTAEDLIKFGTGVIHFKLLEKGMTEQLINPALLSSGESTGYSFGWYVDTDMDGEVMIHHPGSAPGYSSHLLLYPNKDIIIAYIANTGMNTFFNKNFADQVVSIVIRDQWSKK